MGNDVSVQYRDDDGKPRKKVLRTSSLKTQKPEIFTPKDRKSDGRSVTDGPPKKKGATGLKRSNTFTGITAFSRPLVLPKLVSSSNDDKRTAKIFSLRRATKAKETKKPDVSSVIEACEEEGVDESYIDKDDLFIPRRENMNRSRSLSLNTTENNDDNIDKQDTRRASTSSRITLSMNKPDEESKSNTITINQNKPTTVFIKNKSDTKSMSSVDSGVKEDVEEKDFSSQEETQSNSSTFEEAFESTMEHGGNTDTSGGEEEPKRHSTSAEKRRKNVLRSQSMNYQMNRPKVTPSLLESKRSTSIDDGMANIGATKQVDEGQVPTVQKTPLGRRSSDSSLLKEQHVKRSEQFSLMLKQYRQQHQKKSKLSSYGLGVITENTDSEERETQRFRQRRTSDYIDAWLKDQSERIDVLSAAVKGDPEKIRSLRASFRERPLQKPQKDLLPQRPSSVKLPRKTANLNTFISSSDSEDPDDTGSKSLKLIDKNGNFISKKYTKNPLKKQLTDTLLLVDKSFKNANRMTPDLPITGRNSPKTSSTNTIKFCSTPTSTRSSSANNVAVVKPMQLTNKENSSDRTLQVNMVHQRLEEFRIVKKTCNDSIFKDPIGGVLSDKELIKREDAERLANRKVTINNISCSNDLEEDNLTILRENLKATSNSRPVNHTIMTTTCNSRPVDRTTQSLKEVMGDLKTLRDHDVTLAKHLLNLGESITQLKRDNLTEEGE